MGKNRWGQNDVYIKELVITDDVTGEIHGKIAIMVGGFGNPRPKQLMDNATIKYTKGVAYNDFIESHLDMPWLRVILSGINDIDYVEFKDQRLKMEEPIDEEEVRREAEEYATANGIDFDEAFKIFMAAYKSKSKKDVSKE